MEKKIKQIAADAEGVSRCHHVVQKGQVQYNLNQFKMVAWIIDTKTFDLEFTCTCFIGQPTEVR